MPEIGIELANFKLSDKSFLRRTVRNRRNIGEQFGVAINVSLEVDSSLALDGRTHYPLNRLHALHWERADERFLSFVKPQPFYRCLLPIALESLMLGTIFQQAIDQTVECSHVHICVWRFHCNTSWIV